MKKSLLLLLSAVSLVTSAPHDSKINSEFNTVDEHPDEHWTYIDNGKNWPLKSATSVPNNECGTGKN